MSSLLEFMRSQSVAESDFFSPAHVVQRKYAVVGVLLDLFLFEWFCYVVQMKGPMPASTRHDNGINAMAWIESQQGRLLATGGRDGVVKVWR